MRAWYPYGLRHLSLAQICHSHARKTALFPLCLPDLRILYLFFPFFSILSLLLCPLPPVRNRSSLLLHHQGCCGLVIFLTLLDARFPRFARCRSLPPLLLSFLLSMRLPAQGRILIYWRLLLIWSVPAWSARFPRFPRPARFPRFLRFPRPAWSARFPRFPRPAWSARFPRFPRPARFPRFPRLAWSARFPRFPRLALFSHL